jgi:hypothetical protein
MHVTLDGQELALFGNAAQGVTAAQGSKADFDAVSDRHAFSRFERTSVDSVVTGTHALMRRTIREVLSNSRRSQSVVRTIRRFIFA